MPIHLTRRVLLAGAAAALIHSTDGVNHGRAETPDWEPVAPLIPERSEFSGTWFESAIYVAGGFGAGQRFDRYEPATDRWTRLADLPAGRHHAAVVTCQDTIFVIGGHDSGTNRATDTVWSYDPETDRWHETTILPQGPRGAHGAVTFDDQLYVIGGSSGGLDGPATDDVWRFDPATGDWSRCASLPVPREHLAVAAVTNGIVAAGGRNGADEALALAEMVTLYDPASDRWDERAHLPMPRAGLSAVSTGETVIVLGGERMPDLFAAVQEYDPRADHWRDLPALPEARHGIAAVRGETWLYAIGGSKLAGRVENSDRVDRLALAIS